MHTVAVVNELFCGCPSFKTAYVLYLQRKKQGRRVSAEKKCNRRNELGNYTCDCSARQEHLVPTRCGLHGTGLAPEMQALKTGLT
jgi:hypothetical protein